MAMGSLAGSPAVAKQVLEFQRSLLTLAHVFNFPLLGNISATPIMAAIVTFHQERAWHLTNWSSLLLTWVTMTLMHHEANTWRGLDSLLREHLLRKMLKVASKLL